MQFDYRELEKKFQQLPDEIQVILTSPEIASTMKKIAEKNNLLIDQESVMFDLTSYIILGLLPSKDFVKTLMNEADVNERTAQDVARDINSQILNRLKSSMQEREAKIKEFAISNNEDNDSPKDKTAGSLEHFGDITIEKQMPEPENGKVTSADRGDILANLENPPATTISHTSPPPQNLPTSEEAGPFDEPTKVREDHTEPLVDYLLKNPASQSTNATPPITTPPKPKASGSSDPYREQIK